jgi:hypothetical protein
MPYATDENSVAQSRPVELYEFVAGNQIYRYTSYSSSVIYLGQTYTAIPISRGNHSIQASGGDPPEILITLHETAAFVTQNGFSLPPQGMTVTIRRLQQVSNEAIIIWLGKVTSFRIRGREVEVQSPSIMAAALSSQIPSAYLQRRCNHVLYDFGCRVDRSMHQLTTTVTSQTGRVLVVGAVPVDTLKSGEARIGSEFRTIIDQASTTLTLLTAFRSVVPGQAITLFQGCDHTLLTCRDLFGNVSRYGGFPYLSWKNPFDRSHAWGD